MQYCFWEALVRRLGFIAVLAVLVAVAAIAGNEKKPCLGLPGDQDDDRLASDELPLLTDNQCEAAKKREFRLPLIEIPQEEEDPMALSLGAKDGGGILRFKIPFSF
jgi:hypothetical protein